MFRKTNQKISILYLIFCSISGYVVIQYIAKGQLSEPAQHQLQLQQKPPTIQLAKDTSFDSGQHDPESILKMSKKMQQGSFDHPRILNEDTSDHTHAERFKTEIGKRQPGNNKWIILGFASTSYLVSAKMWYHQLSSIGYTEHVIVALDRKVYDELTYNNTLDDHNYYRVLPSGPTGRYLDEPTRAMEGPGYRVWKSERQGENLKK